MVMERWIRRGHFERIGIYLSCRFVQTRTHEAAVDAGGGPPATGAVPRATAPVSLIYATFARLQGPMRLFSPSSLGEVVPDSPRINPLLMRLIDGSIRT